MKTEVQKMDWRTLIDAKADTPEPVIKALDEYFDAFAQPAITTVDGKKRLGDLPCLKCNEPLAGGLTSFFLGKGGFEWGIAHGEGHCRNCGWPARAYHFIKDADGEHLMSIRNVILQYHPMYVSERKKVVA